MLNYKRKTGSGTGTGDTTNVYNIVSAGNIQITNVTSSGIVSSKEYLSNTTPSNYILTSAITDNQNVTIYFIAEPSTTQSPHVSVDGTACTNLTQFTDDRRLFSGSVTIQVLTSRDVMVTSDTGKSAIVRVNRAAMAPTITKIEFVGGYPGGQTEVKQNDVLTVKVTFDSNGTAPYQIDVLDYGISKAKTILTSTTELVQGSIYTSTFTIATRYVGNTAQLLPIQLRAKNSFGTYSSYVISNVYGTTENLYVMKGCDLVPTITVNATTYPPSQAAFKDSETGTINVTVSNFSSIIYSSPNGNFTIASPTIYSASKSITCTNPNIYNDSVANIRVVANRSANGTSTTSNFIVEVADIAPVVNVYHSETFLRSSSLGATYTIYAVGTQNLLNAPSINIPVSGTWAGTGFIGSGKSWQRNILITDAGVKGSSSQTFNTIPTNRAGIPATITGMQNVKGFLSRTLTVPAFGTSVILNTAITNINNIVFNQSFKTAMAYAPIGSAPPIVGGQTIDGLNLSSTNIIILDTQAAAASSAESTITIEETV